jgi:hypothetical protein
MWQLLSAAAQMQDRKQENGPQKMPRNWLMMAIARHQSPTTVKVKKMFLDLKMFVSVLGSYGAI